MNWCIDKDISVGQTLRSKKALVQETPIGSTPISSTLTTSFSHMRITALEGRKCFSQAHRARKCLVQDLSSGEGGSTFRWTWAGVLPDPQGVLGRLPLEVESLHYFSLNQ